MRTWQNEWLNWYAEHRRDLAWRNTKDPYAIWVSEVILQQTRVDQGTDYYHRFLDRFPTVSHLANAPEKDVLKCWEGLGYYSRARNMHHAAGQIVATHGGQLPADRDALLALKGVGPYTAHAVASIAFGLPYAVVDGNVSRVLSRLFLITDDIATGKGHKRIEQQALEILDHRDPGTWNQAVMELGALVCTPVNPRCGDCPVSGICKAYIKGMTDELPVKSPKKKPRDRFFNYLVWEDPGGIHLTKRTTKDIWQNLYEFPLWESDQPVSGPEELIEAMPSYFRSGKEKIIDHTSITHILTHQRIHAVFCHVQSDRVIKQPGIERIERDSPVAWPVHRLVQQYLVKLGFIF
ncbi:MAG: A/G-specific adenine glycosylase [Flavobacteriales bacterium]|nr:A/G-specific adenine glycosylase [Flavobacteriales bacterium]